MKDCNCIFCKIARGVIPSTTVYEDEDFRVILDLAMNHSSSSHPWFQQAAEYLKSLPEGAEPDSSECPYVDYYHFSREYQGGYAQLDGTAWYYEETECRI